MCLRSLEGTGKAGNQDRIDTSSRCVLSGPSLSDMTEFNLEHFLVLAVSTFAGIVASISGFGVGSLLTPLLALRMDLQLAVAAVSIPHLLATAYRFFLIKENLNKDVFIRFGIWSAIGGLAGGLLGTLIQAQALLLVFAILLIFAGTTGTLGFAERMRFPGRLAWIAGLISGAFGGLVGNQGGIRSAALMGFNLSKAEFVATATGVALLVDGARMPVYFFYRSSDLLDAWLPISVATAGVLGGTWLGQIVLHKIPEPIFKRVVSGMILLLGIGILFKVIL